MQWAKGIFEQIATISASYPKEIKNSDININGKIKSKINPIFLSETSNKRRKIINGSVHDAKIKNNPAITQSGNIPFDPRTNSVENDFLKDDRIASKIKIKSPPNVQNGSNSVEIKNSNNLPRIYNINKHYIVINNTYYSNGSEQNISYKKEKTPKSNFITEVNNDMKNNNKKVHNKNHSYDIKNELKFSANKKNKKSKLNTKMIYYKKFLNLNKKYNNSVENDERQQQNNNKKRYILDLLSSNLNSHQYNNSLIPLNSNKYKNKKNLLNSNRPKKKVKNLITKKNNYLSQEKPKNNNSKLNSSPFVMHIKSNILNNKNSNNNPNLKYIKSIKNENNKFTSNFNERRIIDKINKIPSLICCKSSVEKIRNVIEKIYMKKMISIKEKSNPMITVNNSKSSVIIKCRFINRLFNLNFELHISPFNEATNYILIKPNLIKGNSLTFVDFFDKIKKELLN